MAASLRVPAFVLIALLAVLVALTGRLGLGVLVLVIAAMTVLPPFPPVVAGVACVLLPPVPAAIAAASLGAWVVLVPVAAVAIVTLQWRLTAWSAGLGMASFLLISGVPTASAAAGDDAQLEQSSRTNADASSRSIDVQTDLEATSPDAIRARSSVRINAPSAAVRDAILDLQARADEGWMVEAVAVYRNEVSTKRIHKRARWELSILGVEVNYHCVYHWDQASNEIRWELDGAKDNDLDHANGVYSLTEDGDQTVLTYTVEVGSKHRAVRRLKRSMTARNVRKLLESVRARSEAA